MNTADLEIIRRNSAHFDWTDPRPSSLAGSVEITPIDGTRKFAVLWKDDQGGQRVYGAVGGRWMRNPCMTEKTALTVRAHLMSRVQS